MPDPATALEGLLDEEKVRRDFSANALSETEAWLAAPEIDDPSLVDLTDVPFVTIDDARSRDLDQAAHVVREGDGYRVDYALADASHYVKPGSALYDEALARGASFYLPGRMVPMLPSALSEGLVSLNPEVDRRATVFRMRVDASGAPTETSLVRARIRSRHKLAFERVTALYEDDDREGLADGVAESLLALRDVGLLRMHDAREREVVRYRRTELDVGVEGLSFVVSESIRQDVERYNEQLSLLCNIEGARLLRDHAGKAGVQPVFRIHPAPARDELGALRSLIRRLVSAHGFRSERWDLDRAPSLAEWLDGLPSEGEEGRVAQAIHRQAVMINGRSCYRAEPGIHYGVGADVYARFSAPMREVVGVFLHKEAWEAVRGDDGDPHADEALREAVIDSANRSRDVQRRLNQRANELVLDTLFERVAGTREERSATVMGMARGKVYVLTDDPPLDLKAYLPHLRAQYGERTRIADDGVTLITDADTELFRVGDAVVVRVLGKDQRRGRWQLSLTKR